MPGFQELIIKLSPIIIGVGIVLAGVTRLRKKLSTEAQPTLGTYINELGGYVIAAIIALILGIYLLFFDQGSQKTDSGLRLQELRLQELRLPVYCQHTVDFDCNESQVRSASATEPFGSTNLDEGEVDV